MNQCFERVTINFVVFLSLFTAMYTQCMLNNIAGTDSILHDNYKHLSLVNGAIAWEAGVIRRLYDFGQIFPVYKEDKRGRKIIENYEKSEQTSKLVRLIHAFFYRVPGSTEETDFGVTTQLAVNDLTAVKLVADIVAQCEQLQQQHEQFQVAVDYVKNLIVMITDTGWLNKLGPKVTRKNLEQKIKDVQEKPWNVNAETAFVSICASFAKHLAQDLGDEIMQTLAMHQQAAEKFFGVIAAVNKNLRDLFKSEVFKKREDVESFILQALHESNPQNPDALYPPHTVAMILLAFVYKKYSGNRALLKAFYDELNTQLGGNILWHNLDEQWVKESFVSVTQAQALKTIESIFAAQDLMQSIKQHFAEFVYNALQIRPFPAPVGYETAIYEYEKGKKTTGFSDCMCNTMRNFINLYAYDARQNKFTLEQLLANMNILQVHPALAKFLRSFGDVNMASSQQAHDAWLSLISNIPYVAYNKMVAGATGQFMTAVETGKGYLVIPENERTDALLNWLKINGYQVLEKNQYGYELQPSVKNIIIVLDHLLQLNLFGNAGGLAKEFMRSDFIAFYFSKLCAAVKATGYLSTQKDAKQGELDKNFDVLDYTETTIYMTFSAASITCKFTTSSGHGELKLNTILTDKQTFLFMEKINNFAGQPGLSLLVTNLICKQDISFDHLENNPNYLYINLFAAPLENTNLLDTFINLIFRIIKDNTPLKIKTYIKDLLLRLAEKQPDVIQVQNLKLRILQKFVSRLSAADLLSGGVDIKNSFQEAIKAAVGGIVDESIVIRQSALDLFRVLFEKQQGFKEAIQVAEIGINDQSIEIKGWVLDFLKVLVEKGYVSDRVIEIAKKCIDDQDDLIRRYALELFIILVEKDQAFDEAIRAAQKGIIDVYQGIRSSGLILFRTLVEKDRAFAEASEAAQKGIIDVDRDTRFYALTLFGALVGKDQAFAEAMQAALKGISSGDWKIRLGALYLYKDLVEKNQVVQEAIQAAEKGVSDRNESVKYTAVELFEQLIIKAPDEIKRVIQKLLVNKNLKLTEEVEESLRELLK